MLSDKLAEELKGIPFVGSKEFRDIVMDRKDCLEQWQNFGLRTITTSRLMAFICIILYPLAIVIKIARGTHWCVEELFVCVLTLISPRLAKKFLKI